MNCNSGYKQYAAAFIIITLLGIFFLFSTAIPVIEGDIFWNVKTGEWIWKHRALPSDDPFDFTSHVIDPRTANPLRYEVILKGYWLAQILYYHLWSLSGPAGIILLRTAIFLLILLLLYLWMRRESVRVSLAVLFTCFAGYYFKEMLIDRPQYFSFLFFLIAYILLEVLKRQPPFRQPYKNITLYGALPVVMLVWANMHGGYVMGVALIGIYFAHDLAGLLYRQFSKCPGAAANIPFLTICFFSFAAVCINPLTYKVFLFVFESMRTGLGTVSDMKSPIEAAVLYGSYMPTYWIFIALTIMLVVLRPKSLIRRPRYVALLFFALSSLAVQRNIPFFILLTPVLARDFEHLIGDRFKRTVTALSIIVSLLFMLPVVSYLAAHRMLDFRIDSRVFPENAVGFLKEERPSGKMFNLAEWGSYFILALPDYKVFHDGRRLLDDIEVAHDQVLRADDKLIGGIPLWKGILNIFNIDIIVAPATSPTLGEYFPIVEALYRDREFALVYRDSAALVFLRKGRGNDEIIERRSLPKELALTHAINRLLMPRSPKQRRDNIRKIAELYTLMGKPESARQYYDLIPK